MAEMFNAIGNIIENPPRNKMECKIKANRLQLQ